MPLTVFSCPELQHARPDPLPVVRLHSDSDPSFLGELEAYCTKAGIPMANTGGHRPAANGRVEKRIGLCTYSARGLLETAMCRGLQMLHV